MTNAKANSQPFLASHVFRPAIVEAKLMTAKHARDAVYVATLAEELSVIDTKLCAMEEALQVNPASDLQAARPRPCRMPEGGPDANWIREKSSELDLRLRVGVDTLQPRLSHDGLGDLRSLSLPLRLAGQGTAPALVRHGRGRRRDSARCLLRYVDAAQRLPGADFYYALAYHAWNRLWHPSPQRSA